MALLPPPLTLRGWCAPLHLHEEMADHVLEVKAAPAPASRGVSGRRGGASDRAGELEAGERVQGKSVR